MDVFIWIGFGIVVLLILLVGGRAERFNLRLLSRPWQPKYRRDNEAVRDDSSGEADGP